MTRMNRRSVLKLGVAAGLVADARVGRLAAAARLETTPQPGAGQFTMEFVGLFLCDYSSARLLVALPAADGHSARIAVDLRLVDTSTSDPFDVAAAGPGGQQIGIWNIKKAGEIALSGVTGSNIVPVTPTNTQTCPGNQSSAWQSVSWLANVNLIQASKMAIDESKVATYMKLTRGTFGAVMPVNPLVQTQKFVVVDDNDNDVKDGNGAQLIDQPLAASFFYQGTIQAGPAPTIVLPDKAKIVFKAGFAAPVHAVASQLPDKFPNLPLNGPPRRLDHFKHYYGLLKSTAKHQYPGIGNQCGTKQVAMNKQVGRGGGPAHNIEPIFCPPGYLPES